MPADGADNRQVSDTPLRLWAVQVAVEHLGRGARLSDVFAEATKMLAFAYGVPHPVRPSAAVRLILHVSPITDRQTGSRVRTPWIGENPVQLSDNEQVDLVVEAVDAKGFAVPDTLTASVDNPAVATVAAGADGKTFTVIAAAPGSAVVTITDGTLSVTEAIDVVAGVANKLTVTPGAPVEQPPPPPPVV